MIRRPAARRREGRFRSALLRLPLPADLGPGGLFEKAAPEYLSPFRRLLRQIRRYDTLAVAFSGGADSAFLLAFARQYGGFGSRLTAVTLRAPNFSPDEVLYAETFCRDREIPHILLDVPLEEIDGFSENTPERCYYCKKSLFTRILTETARRNIRTVADGTNQDDEYDYRPGRRALQELRVVSPLLDAGLTKAGIRAGLRAMGLSIWDKPAFACLASRIPYGEPVTEEKLAAVRAVEQQLHLLGFRQVRVRHHGEVARIELLPEDFSRFFNREIMQKTKEAALQAGFRFAALDLDGYRMGSLNP